MRKSLQLPVLSGCRIIIIIIGVIFDYCYCLASVDSKQLTVSHPPSPSHLPEFSSTAECWMLKEYCFCSMFICSKVVCGWALLIYLANTSPSIQPINMNIITQRSYYVMAHTVANVSLTHSSLFGLLRAFMQYRPFENGIFSFSNLSTRTLSAMTAMQSTRIPHFSLSLCRSKYVFFSVLIWKCAPLPQPTHDPIDLIMNSQTKNRFSIRSTSFSAMSIGWWPRIIFS